MVLFLPLTLVVINGKLVNLSLTIRKIGSFTPSHSEAVFAKATTEVNKYITLFS